jgi:hypothetical protein
MKIFTNAEFKELRMLVLAEQKLSDAIIGILKERLAEADEEIARLKSQSQPVSAFDEHWRSMGEPVTIKGDPQKNTGIGTLDKYADFVALNQADGHADEPINDSPYDSAGDHQAYGDYRAAVTAGHSFDTWKRTGRPRG